MSLDAIRAKLDKTARRAMAMIARGVIEATDDSSGLQAVQVSGLDGELFDGVEHFQTYGLTAHPHADAEAVIAFVGGTRSHGIAIVVDDRRYRLKGLQRGEVALYDDLGQIVHLTRDGIRIESELKVDIVAPEVTVTADVASIIADTVNLGGTGGAAVARVGDTVAGGVITSGSAKVSAV